nr:IS3 family transposase [Mesorhizobium sp. B4-1-4]
MPIFPNLAKNVTPDGPNQLWVSDITYVTIAAGFVYVAVILDAWSRKVVGYAIGRSIDARLTVAALKAAIERRKPPPGCVHHSDRGSQYAALVYRNLLAKHDLVGSMGRRGNPYDNAKAENFMKTMKVEAVYPMAYETSPMSLRTFPASSMRFTTPADCTQRSAISARNVRGPTRPADGQNCGLICPARGAHSTLGAATRLLLSCEPKFRLSGNPGPFSLYSGCQLKNRGVISPFTHDLNGNWQPIVIKACGDRARWLSSDIEK